MCAHLIDRTSAQPRPTDATNWFTLILDVLEEGVLSGGRGSGRDVCCVPAPSLTSPLELDDEGVPRDSRAADGDVGAGLDDDVVHQLGGQRDDVRLLRGS